MNVYDNIFQESKISTKQRDSLKDSDFGIPDKREYPLTDEEHVRKAVQMFSYADESDRHELAERIVLKAKKFGMNWENWLWIRRYLPDSYKQHIQESVTSDYLYQSDTTSKTLTEYSKNVTGIDDASIVLEGSQSRKTKEKRNMQRTLEKHGYDPETQTILVKHNDGSSERVKINIGEKADMFDVQTKPITNPVDGRVYRPEFEYKHINMTNKTMKMHPDKASPILDHEINHIRRLKSVGIQGRSFGQPAKPIYDYFGDEKDASDMELINNFIDCHSSVLKNISHGMNPEEYLSDLYAARQNGYKKTINLFRSFITVPGKQNLGNWLKHQVRKDLVSDNKKEFINRCNTEIANIRKKIADKNRLISMTSDPEMIDRIKSDINSLSSLISQIERLKESPNSEIVNFEKIDKEVSQFEKDNNIEFLHRIKFLQEMKKFDECKKNKDLFSETYTPEFFARMTLEHLCSELDIVYENAVFDETARDISVDTIMKNLEYEYKCNADIDNDCIIDDYDMMYSIMEYYNNNEKEGNIMKNDFYDLPEDPINIMEMDINDDIDSKTDDLPSKDQDSDDDSKTDDDSDKKITGKDDEDKDDEDEDEDKDDDNETDDDDDEEDAEDEDDKDEENDGDDLESFGSDTDGSTPDNEYNENEIKILNDLIADEEQAMSGYYHGALNSKIDILTRLYANIGDEERFHAEQLMYAKSTITGEKYSPQDPKVKSEYEDLLKMGMDEETAMSTAIDKRNMVDDDDEDDSDMEDIEDDVSVIESAIYQNELLMAICEYKISTVEDCDAAFGLFIESYIYMEEMDNVSSALGKSQRAANPLKLLMKGVNALIKMLMQLSRKTRDYINKSKIRRKRKFDWIKKHGIKDLFAGGVSLYFYSEKTASFDVEEAIRYVDLLYRITKMVAANTGMRLKEPAKYKTIRNPIPFKTTDAAINILHGIVLTKTKVILTDNSEAAILEELFGYKENKLRVGTSRGEDEPIIHESGNFYNRMEALISLTTEYANVANAVVDMLSRFEGDTNSIYYKNRSLYNNATRVMQEVGKSYNTILGAMTHDLNTVMKLDNGILEMSRNRDRIEQTGGQWTGPTSNPSVQAKTNSNKYVERK